MAASADKEQVISRNNELLGNFKSLDSFKSKICQTIVHQVDEFIIQ